MSPGRGESRINLEIVLRLRDTLALYGVDPVVLREADVSLHDPEASTLREKKRSDLKNRVRAVEAVEGGTLLSIHQNSYPGSQYRGAQAFYASTGGSRELAEQVQTALREKLQPDNSLQAKPVPESVYLMNHISCPAVLVECGFLTNPEEEALLRDGGYQKQLAARAGRGVADGTERPFHGPESKPRPPLSGGGLGLLPTRILEYHVPILLRFPAPVGGGNNNKILNLRTQNRSRLSHFEREQKSKPFTFRAEFDTMTLKKSHL